jgi:hypothetical protein
MIPPWIRSGGRLLVVAVLWALPVAVATVGGVGRQERTALWGKRSDPEFGLVGERNIDAAQPARLVLERAPSRSLAWPHEAGVVTSTSANAGETPAAINDGDVLFAVDGVAILAQTVGEPLYRDVRAGMSGGDVLWLDTLLVSLGFAERSTLDAVGRATASTATAIKKLQRVIGAVPDGVFAVRHTMFVPASEAWELTDVVVTPGQRLSSGDPILAEVARLVAARIEPTGPSEAAAFLNEDRLAVQLAQGQIVVGGLQLTAREVAALEPFMTDDAATVVDVRVSLVDPIVIGTVPAAAVIASETVPGKRCVVLASSDGQFTISELPPVALVSDEVGVALVDASLVGYRVMTNPAIAGEYKCE